MEDLCVFVLDTLDYTTTMAFMAIYVYNILCNTIEKSSSHSASYEHPTVIWPILWSHKGGTNVASPE